MKTLILAILFIGVCYGQDKFDKILDEAEVPTDTVKSTFPYNSRTLFLFDTVSYFQEQSISFPESKKNQKVIIGRDTLKTKENVYLIAPAVFLVQQYDKYAKRLNDDFELEMKDQIKFSAEVFNHIQIDYSDDEVIISYPRRTITPDVVTRKKPSFEGFMNYLRQIQQGNILMLKWTPEKPNYACVFVSRNKWKSAKHQNGKENFESSIQECIIEITENYSSGK